MLGLLQSVRSSKTKFSSKFKLIRWNAETAENLLGCRAELCKIIDQTNTINLIKKTINTGLINFRILRMNVLNTVKKYPHNFRYAGKFNTAGTSRLSS